MTSGKINRIVAVDDDERTLRLLVDALGSEGQHVLPFDSGELALSYLSEITDCDLLLLDVEMPGMDGFEVARAVRRLPHLGSLPILALTGMMGVDVPVRILEAGADGYLSKPVDIRELRTIVSDMIRAKSPDAARAEG